MTNFLRPPRNMNKSSTSKPVELLEDQFSDDPRQTTFLATEDVDTFEAPPRTQTIESLEDTLNRLRAHGIDVKVRVKYTHKTFEVEDQLLAKFVETKSGLDLLTKTAINQAIGDWVKKHETSVKEVNKIRKAQRN